MEISKFAEAPSSAAAARGALLARVAHSPLQRQRGSQTPRRQVENDANKSNLFPSADWGVKKKEKKCRDKGGKPRLPRIVMSRRGSLPARSRFVVSNKLNITVYYQPYSNKIKRVQGDSCYLTSFAPIGHGDVTNHATGLFCHG